MKYLNPVLEFTTNWNHKLHCDVFSTFRINGPKYEVGKLFSIVLKRGSNEHYITDAEVIWKKQCALDQVSDFFAWIDTGYSLPEFQNIVHTMYKYKNLDFTKPVFCKLLLKCLNEDTLAKQRTQAGIFPSQKTELQSSIFFGR